MPRVPGDPRFVPGRAISAREMQRIADQAARTEKMSVTGGGNVDINDGGFAMAIPPEGHWWVRITGQSSSFPKYLYSWETVRRSSNLLNWEVDDQGPAGAYTSLPAIEVSHNTTVPVDGTAVAQAWLGDDGQSVYFSYPSGGSGDVVYDGAVTFNGGVTHSSWIAFDDDGAAVTVGGDLDDFTLTTFPVQFFNVTGPFSLTGIAAGVHGQRIIYCNTGNATLTLKNESASSAATNRLRTFYADHADVLLPPNFWVELQYDLTIARWRILWVSSPHLFGSTSDGGLGSNLDNYAVDQRYPFQLLTPTADIDFTGIANGKQGQWYYFAVDHVGYRIRLKHQSSSSSAGNRFVLPNSDDVIVQSGGGFICYYDGTVWRVLVLQNLTAPRMTAITDADVTLPAPVGPQEFAILGVPLTAVRAITLPAANAVKAGTTITVVDKAGSLGSTNYLNMQRAGSDTINGANTYAMQTAYSKLDFVSDGVSKWTVNPSISLPVTIPQGGTSATTPLGAWDNLAAGTRQTITLVSGTTLDLGAATSWSVDVGGTSGVGGVTLLGTANAGVFREVRFTSSGIVLTHHVTALALPGAADITTTAGDTALFKSLGSGNWLCVSYQRNTAPWTGTATISDGVVTFAKMQAINTNVLLGNDGSGTAVEEISCTAAGRALLDDTDAAAQRTTLGIGSASHTTAGLVELATTTEAQTGTDTSRAVTPAGLRAATREKLTAARTYYVRTDGSDSNTGLVDSSGGAFLTIQKAIDTICETLDLGGQTVTIQVGSGTFTDAVVLYHTTGGGFVLIDGAGMTSTTISTTSADCIVANDAGIGWTIRNLKLQTTTSGTALTVRGSAVSFSSIAFGNCATDHIAVRALGKVGPTGNYTINGNARIHIFATQNGVFDGSSAHTVTLSGTPAWTNQGVNASNNGNVTITGATYSGSATGTRYSATVNGTINTAGGGASFFPGNASGSTATGGQYV